MSDEDILEQIIQDFGHAARAKKLEERRMAGDGVMFQDPENNEAWITFAPAIDPAKHR